VRTCRASLNQTELVLLTGPMRRSRLMKKSSTSTPGGVTAGAVTVNGCRRREGDAGVAANSNLTTVLVAVLSHRHHRNVESWSIRTEASGAVAGSGSAAIRADLPLKRCVWTLPSGDESRHPPSTRIVGRVSNRCTQDRRSRRWVTLARSCRSGVRPKKQLEPATVAAALLVENWKLEMTAGSKGAGCYWCEGAGRFPPKPANPVSPKLHCIVGFARRERISHHNHTCAGSESRASAGVKGVTW